MGRPWLWVATLCMAVGATFFAYLVGKGLHSSTFLLNPSRF